ncbi:hypothetical protein SI90_07735 [Akkermansia muciniphila]|uniref:hypothetical protein n=1 Tax=Akkermansia muciniphila TaxID=239935 RepID=UPI000FF8C457|nr:hypothetical protein [Akkermansia muciniphila]QAR50376.1 hypothetical protein SI90_07735 [Akkermansia muciniphila]
MPGLARRSGGGGRRGHGSGGFGFGPVLNGGGDGAADGQNDGQATQAHHDHHNADNLIVQIVHDVGDALCKGECCE